MQTKIDALLLSKTPYREKDLLTTLLLPHGQKIAVCFYGGRTVCKGGHPASLEVGHFLQIELRLQKKAPCDLFTAKEWSLKWHHQKLRHCWKGASLMYFACELIRTEATCADPFDEESFEHTEAQALFRLLSNFIYYLDREVLSPDFLPAFPLAIFLAKLLLILGVAPRLNLCVFCETPLQSGKKQLIPMQGGFACGHCLDHLAQDESALHLFMSRVKQLKYAQCVDLLKEGKFNSFIPPLWNYLLFHHPTSLHLPKALAL